MDYDYDYEYALWDYHVNLFGFWSPTIMLTKKLNLKNNLAFLFLLLLCWFGLVYVYTTYYYSLISLCTPDSGAYNGMEITQANNPVREESLNAFFVVCFLTLHLYRHAYIISTYISPSRRVSHVCIPNPGFIRE